MQDQRNDFKRREFLKTSGALALGAGLPLSRVLADEPSDANGEQQERARVGIARGSNIADSVAKAVRLAGGLDFIQEDQTVLIKPNVTGAREFPTTTNPEMLYGVIKVVAERGPKRILVSDRSFSPLFVTTTPKTVDVMKAVGHVDAVNQAISDFNAPVVAVGLEDAREELERLGVPKEKSHWRKMKLELATHWPDGFELAELLLSVDHVINVPVIKTHFQAWFTMSMKAFVGMSHHRTRREFHRTWVGEGSLADQKRTRKRSRRRGFKRDLEAEANQVAPFVSRIAELNLGLKPAMNILDGSRSFVFGGPSSGDIADPNLVVATSDRVAADATGVAVLKNIGTEERLQKRSVWTNPFIKYGIQIGLGVGSHEQIDLRQEGLDEEIVGIREMLA